MSKNRSNNTLRPKLLVFSGPPCSGKTRLSKFVSKKYRRSVRFEMDGIRQAEMPWSDHTKADRNIAYRKMHSRAYEAFEAGKRLVILDATYGPREHRDAAVSLAKIFSADLFLVECRVSANDAVERFRNRPSGHPAIDLDEARVREIPGSFPYYGGGCVLDTSKSSEKSCFKSIIAYLESGKPLWSVEDWAKSGTNDLVNNAQQASSQVTDDRSTRKISPLSRINAEVVLFLHSIPMLIPLGSGLYGVWRLLHKDPNGAILWFTIGTWAVASLALFEFWGRRPIQEALKTLTSGYSPVYGQIREVQLSNRQLYFDYLERSSVTSRAGFAIEGVPIYFLIPPNVNQHFNIVVEPTGIEWDRKELETVSNEKWGFDWNSYAAWRKKQKWAEYYGFRRSTVKFRVSDIKLPDAQNPDMKVIGTNAEYTDYLVAEQSVNLEIPRQLPYMREFFEGDNWANKSLNLSVIRDSCARYSMIVSVSLLITTSDGFIVLQRRSNLVQAAVGGIASSATGMVNWHDVNGIFGRRSMKRSLYRECLEELGLFQEDFFQEDKPFIAAAYNLKYGRDLNFYAHFQCNLTQRQISTKFLQRRTLRSYFRGGRRDHWEVAHILFIPTNWVNVRGEFAPRLEEILGDACHARAIIYASAIAGRLETSSKQQDYIQMPSSV